MSDYYPFRSIDLPEVCSSTLTHGLLPTITTGRSNGEVSFWTVLAELPRRRSQPQSSDGEVSSSVSS